MTTTTHNELNQSCADCVSDAACVISRSECVKHGCFIRNPVAKDAAPVLKFKSGEKEQADAWMKVYELCRRMGMKATTSSGLGDVQEFIEGLVKPAPALAPKVTPDNGCQVRECTDYDAIKREGKYDRLEGHLACKESNKPVSCTCPNPRT